MKIIDSKFIAANDAAANFAGLTGLLNGRREASDPYIRGEWSSLASIESRRVWRRARAIARLKLTGLMSESSRPIRSLDFSNYYIF